MAPQPRERASAAPRPSPYQIAAFTVAARELSFSRAARRLGVTQSSVTQHVAKLEQMMGTKLFVRRQEGLELTRGGRELFELSDRLRVFEDLVAERVASYGTLEAGHLKVIANAPRPVLPVIARFAELYPDIRIEFEVCDWTTAMRLLRERSADVGLITEPDRLAGLDVREVGDTAYALHVPSDHRLARRRSVSLEDLADESVLLAEEGSFTRRILQAKLRTLGLELPRTIDTRTFPLIKEGVLHGLGVGILLADSVYPSSDISLVPIEEMPERYANCLVTYAEKSELRVVKRFADVATAVLGAGPATA